MQGAQVSQNSGQPCSSKSGRPRPVRAKWTTMPFTARRCDSKPWWAGSSLGSNPLSQPLRVTSRP